MKSGVYWLCLLLAATALAPLVYIVYNNSVGPGPVPELNMAQPIASIEFSTTQPKELAEGSELEVKACRVIDGYRFVMTLEGDNAITAHLANATTEAATGSVVEILNESASKPPSVVLLRRVGDYWIVDFLITVDGERSSLTDILSAKGLLL